MPEIKEQASARAKREGFPQSQVISADNGDYFIAPNGIKKHNAKKAYANCRSKGGDKASCAAMAWNIEK